MKWICLSWDKISLNIHFVMEYVANRRSVVQYIEFVEYYDGRIQVWYLFDSLLLMINYYSEIYLSKLGKKHFSFTISVRVAVMMFCIID